MKDRYSQRVPVDASVIFTVGGLTYEGQVLNLTVPGCMVESPISPQKGDCMPLRLFIPEFQTSFDVSMGVVRWVNGRRFGLEFIGMEQNERLRYNACVAELSTVTTDV